MTGNQGFHLPGSFMVFSPRDLSTSATMASGSRPVMSQVSMVILPVASSSAGALPSKAPSTSRLRSSCGMAGAPRLLRVTV